MRVADPFRASASANNFSHPENRWPTGGTSSVLLRRTKGDSGIYVHACIYIYTHVAGVCMCFFSPHFALPGGNIYLLRSRILDWFSHGLPPPPQRRRRRWTVGGARQGSKIGICRRRSPFGQNHYCFPSTRRRRTGPPAGPYVSRRVYHLISGSGTRRVVIIIVIIVMGPARRGFSRSENILHNS